MDEARKLAAILVADVVGFSRLAGADEDRTLARLRALRSDLIDPTIAIHKGRVVKRTGDGAIVEFRSVVDAVRCAIEVQNSMIERNTGLPQERRIEFRIGVHLGDVVEESDGDLMGDGVNIAARLEGIAQPGAICLSEDAYRQVKSRLDVAISDLGETRLKNIADPIRVYSLLFGSAIAKATTLAGPASSTALNLSLPDKPSIAVLPFQNMSGDPEQEYFADGIVEDIITALSRFRQLFVIARNSSFVYKGRAVDVKQVSRDLGVRYVLEGSVRKAADRIRITAQLIDTSTGAHLWAERFDGGLQDIFDLQDQVAARVVGEIAPKLEQAEIERAKRKPTESLDAYDYFLRGMASVNQWTRVANDEALRLFYKAVELDPEFGSAYGMAAWCYIWRKLNGWVINRAQETAEGARLARRAVEVGKDDPVALSRGGHALAWFVRDLDSGAAFIDRALALNPNLAAAWNLSGWVRAYRGELDLSIEHHARAMRLSPLDPILYNMHVGTAFAHFQAGRYVDATAWANSALHEQPNYPAANRILAASNALSGHMIEAQQAMAHLRELDPALRISNLTEVLPLRAEDLAKLAEGLRRAGLPE
ncbi:adenylate/guanylate cyclase domain-containing protein [Bradyrhizobium jicamae]|uniref:Adenylate/guanylate cyclase domain-containing protein n=1 Tax=Bradyrhizobium jicamae TaxID=280332 RepID=A0ABS5FRY6_9BRAD|nr:adenylate/guanylate cyclase domain-containing protein [Bradyrhizobium jicamae]MBR0799582.1 adenylate/guanylate cyclase domain-containing protein [Bradyrhizobium jicamae]MBR0937442.1 adenylate/guanylate cyclase domain-containing protein [Bradyrhizobium jicamae]